MLWNLLSRQQYIYLRGHCVGALAAEESNDRIGRCKIEKTHFYDVALVEMCDVSLN